MPGTLRTLTVTILVFLTAIGLVGTAMAGPSPSITNVTPPQAPSYGGFDVSITGTRLQAGATLTFGGTPAAEAIFISDTQINAVTPLAAKGTVDVVVTNPDGKSASWSGFEFFFDGDGVFALEGYRLAADHDSTYDAEFGDVDGDGDLDVLMVIGGQPALRTHRLHLNDGSGGFTDVTETHLPLWKGSYDGDFGDVDGDGDLDIVFAGYGQVNRLYLNDGTGVYTDVTSTAMPTHYYNTRQVDFGDVDGDGDLDIINGNYNQQDHLYLNDGTGVFSDATASQLPIFVNRTRDVEFGDVDGDGDLDIVTLSYNYPVQLYLNNGAGFFSDVSATHMPSNYIIAWEADFGDIDGDGDLDLLATVGLYTNDGTGVFTYQGRLPVMYGTGLDADFGDVDGDGDLDIAVGNSSSTNELFLNDGSGNYTNVTATNLPENWTNTYEVDFGDVDADGDLDLVTGNGNYKQNRLFINDGTGVFTDVTQSVLPNLTGAGYDVRMVDVDGDGDQDALIADYYRNRLNLNDGEGIFTDATATHMPETQSNNFAMDVGDVDGDGDLDAVFASNQNQNLLFLSDGGGHFIDATASSLPVDADYSYDVDLGDVDGDDDLDLYITNYFYAPSGQNRLYLNDGTGVFTDVTVSRLPAFSDDSRSAEMGDVDGDGDLDIVVANYGNDGTTQNRLYLNDGTGLFSDATAASMPIDSDISYGAALGDVDGDGDLDIAFSNYGQGRLYLNDGSGAFTPSDAGAFPLSASVHNQFTLADADGDGDLDVFQAVTLGQSRLFLNDGSGVFTEDVGRFPTHVDGSMVGEFSDVDADGDLDIYVVSGNQDRLYENVRLVDTEPPTIPTSLTATASACDQIDLSWNASDDNVAVAGYTVYRDGLAVGTSATTSYADAGLIENTLYSYTVDAYDAAGNTSPQSAAASDTTPLCEDVLCEDYTEKGPCNDDPDCEWQGSPRNGTCVSVSSGVCNDNDADGWGDPGDASCPNGAATDCDDSNPAANPGMTEGPEGDGTCLDGFDNDCDNLIDIADPDCQPPVDCAQYPDKNTCNGDPACKWNNRNGICESR